MKIAVIDCGTNTFNLLVGEFIDKQTFRRLFYEKIPVKLGEGGIHKNKIVPTAFERGLNAMEVYAKKIKEFEVDRIVALGTSAIRSAENGEHFVEQVKERTGIEITVIDGNREAELIYLGVKEAYEITENTLIMDIGGGSTEFIIANHEGILWKQSYELGVSRLFEMFTPQDPLSAKDITEISNYTYSELKSLFDAANKHKVNTLVGSSGSFDTIAELIYYQYNLPTNPLILKSTEINQQHFDTVTKQILKADKHQRYNMKGMSAMRVDTIGISVILIQVILKNIAIKNIHICSYALKEGAFFEIAKHNTAKYFTS